MFVSLPAGACDIKYLVTATFWDQMLIRKDWEDTGIQNATDLMFFPSALWVEDVCLFFILSGICEELGHIIPKRIVLSFC